MNFCKQIWIAAIFPLITSQSNAQQTIVQQRIFLVGDAGELINGKNQVIDWLTKNVNWNDTSNLLIYLGDNIYPAGLPAEDEKHYAAAKNILDYQIDFLRNKKARAIFIPGNHDWKQGKPGGWQQIKNLNRYIESLQMHNIQVLPKNGCAGPNEILVGDKTVIVCMDSQWWLQQNEKPGIESECDTKTEEEILTSLKSIINTHPDRLIILAMHHPFYTNSIHGGYFTWKQHIFPLTDANPNLFLPLPIIGSLYPVSRKWLGNIQDTKHPKYKHLIEKIEAITKKYPNVIQVAGHDHSLQLLKKDSSFFIVSATGSKSSRVKPGGNALYTHNKKGFAVIEIISDGSSRVNFYDTDSPDLQTSIFTAPLPSVPVPLTTEKFNAATFPDSVTIIASSKFKSGALRNFIFGTNYRKEWTTPVKVQVLSMDTTFGGLTPIKMGGGHQTKSLRLQGKNGKEYVLRQIEKNVTDAALPPDLRGLDVVSDIISDGVSASYPYAALSIPPLAEALNIPHANPQLVYVPQDPLLGMFLTDFANSSCLLEERNPTDDETNMSTDKMEEKLLNHYDYRIDQKAVLLARLLDLFVMDFDRHEDQWRWAIKEKENERYFYPIPRDRDQPFFINSGLIPYLAGSASVSPQIQGFKSKARNIKTFNYNDRNFDRNYMNELTREDWETAATALVNTMTDELIEKSLGLQPAEIQIFSKNNIINKLKKRKHSFVEEMLEYYDFLSKVVTVYGSNKKELFNVHRHNDGAVSLTVYKLNKNNESYKVIYERKFISNLTKEIRLFGMDGNDSFNIHGKDAGKIKILVVGGTGKDAFNIETESSPAKTKIFDLSTEQNTFSGSGRYANRLSNDPRVNDFNMRDYSYNTLAPFIAAAYNPDDGLYLGLSFKYTKQNFRKKPFAVQHQFSVAHSLATKAYRFNYNLILPNLISKTDMLFRATLNAPNNTTNFFTYGNETEFDKTKKDNMEYYRARFELADINLMLRRNFISNFWIAAGPAFQYYTYDSSENVGRLISMSDINGLDEATLSKPKSYGGIQLMAAFDNRNNIASPSRGINWQTTYSGYAGLGEYSNNFSRLNSELSFYMSFNKQARLVIANRFGGGINFGNFEFYQAQFLSGSENLRGYRKYRYSGTKTAFHNIDLRMKLTEFQTYLFPGSVGLLAFHDFGRVWAENDQSKKWHQGYGGGIWISPLSRYVINAIYGYGSDGGLITISTGFQF